MEEKKLLAINKEKVLEGMSDVNRKLTETAIKSQT